MEKIIDRVLRSYEIHEASKRPYVDSVRLAKLHAWSEIFKMFIAGRQFS